MPKTSFRHAFVAALLAVAMLAQGTWALAGTTGSLSGTVRDAETGAVIAGANVTATSPSQSASTTTDASGHFSFVSLAPDAYSVSVVKNQYETTSLPGISIFADNAQTITIALRKTLTTIAHVTSRSSGDLLKPGTTADVYSVNATTQDLVKGFGGGGALNSAYSGIASVPGVYIPQGQNGWAQSVYVRGANYTQLGYEFDGVPVQRAFDQYPSTNVSALGQQELQVYTGAAPANAQSSAIGGYINQVIKTGTNPGFGAFEGGLGTPTYYHKVQFEAGGASPNRLFSYYVASAGYNQGYRYASQFDGADLDTRFGSPYNIVAQNCGTANPSAGCYANAAGLFGVGPLGPNGYAFGPFYYGITSEVADRESVANVHFALPHKHDAGRDDIQLLYDVGYLRTQFPTAFSDWTYAQNNVLNGTATYNGANFLNCGDPSLPPGAGCAILPGLNPGAAPGSSGQAYVDTTFFTGGVGQVLTPAMLGQVSTYLQPGSNPQRQAFGTTPVNERDFSVNNSSVIKAQYQKNLGSNAFIRAYGYYMYSNWLNQALSGSTLSNFYVGSVPPDYELITHTGGVSLAFVDQINAQHLLNITTGYTKARTVRWNNQWYAASRTVAVAVDANDPTNGICYGGTPGAATAMYCGSASAWQYRVPVAGSPLVLAPRGSAGSPDVTTIGAQTCGTGPCEYLTVNNGLRGPYNTVAPEFSNFSIEDTFKPNDRLTLNLGVHYDNFKYGLSDTTKGSENQPNGATARTLWQNSFNAWKCFDPVLGLFTNTAPNSCPAGSQAGAWSNVSPSSTTFNAWQPRVGATLSLNPQNVLRFSWGKYEQPASSAFQQYNNANYDLGNADAAFYGFGFRTPTHPIKPEESYNLDFSWEHQVRGSDLSWKITPFDRNTKNEIFNVLLDPRTNFVSGINVGRKKVQGVELAIRKGNFNQNGLAGMLSYTYTHGTVKFDTLPSGTTVVDGINQAITAYNAFTQGGGGSPCYTTAGAADPSCLAGSIANPYFNDKPHALFNANDEFVVYNQVPGNGPSAVASSYIIPHVASLVLNYKRNKWSFTPMLQMSAGGQYGSPVQGAGIDPTSCAGILPGSTTNDPRYPFGAAGGSPYDASTCAGSIVTPDLVTNQFDNFGAFREPTQIVGNMQITYQASPRVTLQLLGVNIYNNCFGGTKQVWITDKKTGCWYTAGGQYTGNFFNPGDTIQPFTAFPYQPTFGNVFQQAYGGEANPFQLFFSATVKL